MYWPYYYPVYFPTQPITYNNFSIPPLQFPIFIQQNQVHQSEQVIHHEHTQQSSEGKFKDNFEPIKLTLTKQQLLDAGYQIGRSGWTQEQDEKLLSLVKTNPINWKEIAQFITGRNEKMCYSRYRRLISSNRRKWKKQQDDLILKLIEEYGFNWKLISSHFTNRSSKLLKEHYTNHLAPNINKDSWTLQQDLKFIELLNKEGRNWKLICQQLQGRTVTQLKNRYFGRLKRLQQSKHKKNH